MTRLLLCLALYLTFLPGPVQAEAGNPFLSRKAPENASRDLSMPQFSFLGKVALYQQQLKEKMAALIREARKGEEIAPILTILLIGFAYGVIHAAGPGHGKAVAMSFMLSRNASMGGGLLFGTLIAFFHGLSGAVCVLGLRFILQKGVSGTLGTVSYVTQIVSFSLVTLLGLGILLTKGHALFSRSGSGSNPTKTNFKESNMALLPWAFTVGVIPCPAVVMVLLFCLSMNMLILGLFLAAFISLGMAVTISLVVIAVSAGKGLSISALAKKGHRRVEGIIGMVSGLIITSLGLLFLATTLRYGSF